LLATSRFDKPDLARNIVKSLILANDLVGDDGLEPPTFSV
jgi:hypothetical protein